MLVYSTIDWGTFEKHFHPDCVDYRIVSWSLLCVLSTGSCHWRCWLQLLCSSSHAGTLKIIDIHSTFQYHALIVIMGWELIIPLLCLFLPAYRDEIIPYGHCELAMFLASFTTLIGSAYWRSPSTIFCAVSHHFSLGIATPSWSLPYFRHWWRKYTRR